MSSSQRLCATALCLCLSMLVFSPSMSLAGGQGAVAAKAKKCKKGYVRKGHRCVKKKKKTTHKPASNVPADGSYSAADFGLSIATTSGKRSVTVLATVPVTCPSGATTSSRFRVPNMPLTGTTFTGSFGPDPNSPEFGQSSMSGNFLSATSVHLTVQVTGYQNGSETCTGQLDVTEALQEMA